eukprot:1766276-Amphidinium_carterae.1
MQPSVTNWSKHSHEPVMASATLWIRSSCIPLAMGVGALVDALLATRALALISDAFRESGCRIVTTAEISLLVLLLSASERGDIAQIHEAFRNGAQVHVRPQSEDSPSTLPDHEYSIPELGNCLRATTFSQRTYGNPAENALQSFPQLFCVPGAVLLLADASLRALPWAGGLRERSASERGTILKTKCPGVQPHTTTAGVEQHHSKQQEERERERDSERKVWSCNDTLIPLEPHVVNRASPQATSTERKTRATNCQIISERMQTDDNQSVPDPLEKQAVRRHLSTMCHTILAT